MKVDHYASVEMARFGQISSAVGGVEVCLREATRDELSGADFSAGKQTLAGEQALAFLRQRHGLPNGDLDRVVRQQALLKALAAKVIGGSVLRDPVKLAALLEVVRTSIRVDEGWDLADFARGLTAGGGVRTATIPVGDEPTTVPGSGGVGLAVDPAEVRTFVDDFLAEKPAGTATDQACVN